MQGPRPPDVAAPSTWYADVAVPKMNPLGNASRLSSPVDAKPTAAERHDGQGQQQQLDAAAMRCRRSRWPRGAHPGEQEARSAR